MPLRRNAPARSTPDAGRAGAVSGGRHRFETLWQRVVQSPPATPGSEVWRMLADALGGPGRHYHTLAHVGDCLRVLDRVRGELAEPDAVETALWFHDALLEPGAFDNERRSAGLFLDCARGGASGALRLRIARLILATSHMRSGLAGDAAYIVDIDLAGLAEPWDEFMHKGDLLRREAAGQDDAAYYRGQVRFLGILLSRSSIYATEAFRREREPAARANLERLLALRAEQGYAPA